MKLLFLAFFVFSITQCYALRDEAESCINTGWLCEEDEVCNGISFACPDLPTFFEVMPENHKCRGEPTKHTPSSIRPYAEHATFVLTMFLGPSFMNGEGDYATHQCDNLVAHECNGKFGIMCSLCTVYRVAKQDGGHQYFLDCERQLSKRESNTLIGHNLFAKIFENPECTVVPSELDPPFWTATQHPDNEYLISIRREGIRLADIIAHPLLIDDGCSGCHWTLEEGKRGHVLHMHKVHRDDEAWFLKLDLDILVKLKELRDKGLEYKQRVCTPGHESLKYFTYYSLTNSENTPSTCSPINERVGVAARRPGFGDCDLLPACSSNDNSASTSNKVDHSLTQEDSLLSSLKLVLGSFTYVICAMTFLTMMAGFGLYGCEFSPFLAVCAFGDYIYHCSDRLIEWLNHEEPLPEDESNNDEFESEPEPNPSTKSEDLPKPENEK